jgi:hypothetical protein
LRASGIPARISIGQTLKDKWKIPLDNKGSSLVQGMGEGLHAWIEVWYPDLGWLPCDPQQSRLFTSTRHVKFGHGLDADDVLEYWSGVPVLPRMSDSFEAKYSSDTVNLRLRETLDQPTSYILAGPVDTIGLAQNEPPVLLPKPLPVPIPHLPVVKPPKPIVIAKDEQPIIKPKPVPLPVQPLPKPEPVKPEPLPVQPIKIVQDEQPTIKPKPVPPPLQPLPKPEPVKPKPLPVQPLPKPLPKPEPAKPILTKHKPAPVKPKPGTNVEIGNRDFPSLMEAYRIDGNVGQRSFDRETAEYATSKYLYAQAFTLDTPLALKEAGLAMRKFGGDGSVYLDIVRDQGGKPSLDGFRSRPVSLETITRKPGYYWVDFTLPDDTHLMPGKYWLVLRHSGEAILNWFYTPGKRVNGPDDSRSTALGWQWEDVLSGEFVYRVRGVALQ